MTKDYKVDVRVKNNLLYKAMVEEGYETAADLSRASGVTQSSIGNALNLKLSLHTRWGHIREAWIKLSKTLRRLPEDLVPKQHHYEALENNRASMEMDFGDVSYLIEKSPEQKLLESSVPDRIDEMLDTLTPTEKEVVEAVFGLNGKKDHTGEEISQIYGFSRTRSSQIARKALRKLKHKSRGARELLDALSAN